MDAINLIDAVSNAHNRSLKVYTTKGAENTVYITVTTDDDYQHIGKEFCSLDVAGITDFILYATRLLRH